MELKHNISFEDLRSINSGKYKLSSLRVNDLINNDIKEFLGKNLILHNKKSDDLGWTINISHIDQYESIINIIYKNEKPYIRENKEVKIYKFLEKYHQKLENPPQKKKKKSIFIN